MHEFTYSNGELFCEKIKVEEIAREVGTPLYLYSQKTLINHYRNFREALAGMEDPLVCYAYKANANLALARILVNEGCGADIVSGGELQRALRVGTPPEKIVFNGNGKTAEELKMALEADILMFNVDSEAELLCLNEIAKQAGKQARIALRVNPDIDPQTHPHIATGLRESKFGFEFSRVIEGYKLADKLENIQIAGIHMHIGSQITKVTPFREALKKISGLVKKLRALGMEIQYVNVGGGLGIVYNEENPPTLADYAGEITSALKKMQVQGIFEPGRVLMGNAGVLITEVLYLKKTKEKNFVVVDAGMGDLFRPAFYSAHHEISPVNLQGERESLRADIVGPICESGDFLAKNREIPAVTPGEYLAVFSAGAYGFSMASNYNSRRRPAEVLVEGHAFRIIRKRETYEDLMRGEE